MPADAADARIRRLYAWVIVTEALVILGLWSFQHLFS
jgi:hypothetical protein